MMKNDFGKLSVLRIVIPEYSSKIIISVNEQNDEKIFNITKISNNLGNKSELSQYPGH